MSALMSLSTLLQVGRSAFEDQGNGSPNDFRNLFKDIFDNDVSLEPSFMEVVEGCAKTVTFPAAGPVKGGSGVPPGTRPESCKHCKGSGMTFMQTGPFRMHATCSNCGRNGKTFAERLLEAGRTIQKEHF
ncbi:chaperone protein dnaJ GFA2 mitochondrial [Prunus yedoensis var. nudiflora]|uniref:Chaperone protein dnaJ GFA2 mitochondrial n=1 Tax=Prunus yedoensis var. nudiflora TaxID=2094558 RepID=A0A314Z1H1_PRUYE|nr:chaperone protein dnaJ GFA2 mitochondrial [Prunus yedoensis var. nudiflora]